VIEKEYKNKIKQPYNTTQRNEKHLQTFVHSLNPIYQIMSISTVQQIEQASNVTKSIRTTEKAWTKGYARVIFFVRNISDLSVIMALDNLQVAQLSQRDRATHELLRFAKLRSGLFEPPFWGA